MAKSMRFEPIPQGGRVYKGDLLLAVVTMRHHNSGESAMSGEEAKAFRAGAVVWTGMPPYGWSVHFTSPSLSVADAQAVLACIPAGDDVKLE